MYEQAFRLNQFSDPDALEKQVKCFLAAKTALALCEPQHAYIVMPVDQVEDKVVVLPTFAGADDVSIAIRPEIIFVEGAVWHVSSPRKHGCGIVATRDF
jgi:hypothetical protein